MVNLMPSVFSEARKQCLRKKLDEVANFLIGRVRKDREQETSSHTKDERRRRGQATQGVTPGRPRGRASEGVTLMLLTPPLHRKV